jgi:hypothetical protein
VGTLVIRGINPSIDVKEREAAPVIEPDSFRLARRNFAEHSDTHPLRCSFCHELFLL